jgi:lysophospholipase L1-like esterase
MLARAAAVVGVAMLVLSTSCSSPDVRRAASPTAPATATAASVGPATATAGARTVVFIGDSWTDGTGASRSGGFPALTAELLGWEYTELGVSGSGYVVPGAGGPFRSRIAQAVAGAPDVIVVQGSLNEQRVDVDELGRAALDTLTELRQEADPATDILVVGAPDAPGTDPVRIDRVNDAVSAAVSAAAAAADVRFVDPAAEGWTDPDDPALWADPIHPNDAGHREIAERLAPILEDVVQR